MEKQRLSEMGLECLNIIEKKFSKQMTKEEYYSAIYQLDKKYPGLGFKEAAQKFIRQASNPDLIPKDAWKKKAWPFAGPFEALEPELTDQEAKVFELKSREVKERLPYKDD